jgi:hypothetical protein
MPLVRSFLRLSNLLDSQDSQECRETLNAVNLCEIASSNELINEAVKEHCRFVYFTQYYFKMRFIDMHVMNKMAGHKTRGHHGSTIS